PDAGMAGIGDQHRAFRQRAGELAADALGTHRHRVRVRVSRDQLAPLLDVLLHPGEPGRAPRAARRARHLEHLPQYGPGVAQDRVLDRIVAPQLARVDVELDDGGRADPGDLPARGDLAARVAADVEHHVGFRDGVIGAGTGIGTADAYRQRMRVEYR